MASASPSTQSMTNRDLVLANPWVGIWLSLSTILLSDSSRVSRWNGDWMMLTRSAYFIFRDFDCFVFSIYLGYRMAVFQPVDSWRGSTGNVTSQFKSVVHGDSQLKWRSGVEFQRTRVGLGRWRWRPLFFWICWISTKILMKIDSWLSFH